MISLNAALTVQLTNSKQPDNVQWLDELIQAPKAVPDPWLLCCSRIKTDITVS